MITFIAWTATAIGFTAILIKRQGTTIAVLTLQTTLIALDAVMLVPQRGTTFLLAAAILCGRAIILAALMIIVARRTSEDWRRRTERSPLLRVAIILTGMVILDMLIPPLGSLAPAVQTACLSLLATGIGIVILRHGTLFQLIGILIAENALALLAVSVPGGLPILIELGSTFDLLVVLSVGLAFHSGIAHIFGSTNTTLMRDLHD